MEFEARKLHTLRALSSPLPDKSRKGDVDAPIADLIHRINKHPSFFTTSSCSGRISISTSSPSSSSSSFELSSEPRKDADDDVVRSSDPKLEEVIPNHKEKKKKKKKGGDWSFVSHYQADPEEVLRALMQNCRNFEEERDKEQNGGKVEKERYVEPQKYNAMNGGKVGEESENQRICGMYEAVMDGQQKSGKNEEEKYIGQQNCGSLMVFRFEPFILAAECRDLASAQALVSCAIFSGFRESGITSMRKRIIVAVRCSIRIEAPIALGDRLLVSQDYIRFLVAIANSKLASNHQKTNKFLSSFIQQVEVTLHGENIEPRVSFKQQKYVKHEKESYLSEKCNSKSRRLQSNERKLSELEKRQLRLISRLDEAEKKLHDLFRVPVLDVEELPDLKMGTGSTISGQQSKQGLEELSYSKMGMGSITSERQSKQIREPDFKLPLKGFPSRSLLSFGGYGGSLRQGRQNDLVLLTLDDSVVQSIDVENPPTPRMGHTASLVGSKMVVIGGREDPSKPLGDVCLLMLDKMQWKYPQMEGVFFPPRHRHAAVAIEEKVYVFGGLTNEKVLGDLYILDTNMMQWTLGECKEKVPAPRHSHSMSVIDKKIYLFGGFDGASILGDLWVLDPGTLIWTCLELNSVRRFSHSMTVVSDFLVLLGGCPLTKNKNIVTFLNVNKKEWRHVVCDVPSESLFVRHTATSIGNEIVVIGGGVTCYAFGIRFSTPILMDLGSFSPNRTHENGVIHHPEAKFALQNDMWVLKIDKAHAKIIKDYLKRHGWLDIRKKVKTEEHGLRVIFPITLEAASKLQESDLYDRIFKDCFNVVGGSVDCEITQLKVQNESKSLKDPREVLHNDVLSLLRKYDKPQSLIEELPKRWERLDDMAVLPADAFKNEIWSSLGEELWAIVARSLNVQRVARQARVAANGTRDSKLTLLLGNNGWVQHRENSILYCFDATKCMFSSGNVSEKMRIAKLNCSGETVIDLFAGIGYFVLPFLLKANAKRVYACEWNPPALDALRYNLQINAVGDRCIVLEGDNRCTAPHGIADRVCLGLLPTSEHCWGVAVKALRMTGGMLHIHGNVKDTEEQQWVQYVLLSVKSLAEKEGYQWDVHATHIERVKSYAPHIWHLVVDVKCKATIIGG